MLPEERHVTASQQLMLELNTTKSICYDRISLFSLRPVELMELFPKNGEFYRWFETEEKVLDCPSMTAGLDVDISCCQWIDGLGCRI